MEDLKYLSIDDLERFVVNLRDEVEHLKATVERSSNYRLHDDVKSLEQRTLEASMDMLVHAEAEILERTLLGKS